MAVWEHSLQNHPQWTTVTVLAVLAMLAFLIIICLCRGIYHTHRCIICSNQRTQAQRAKSISVGSLLFNSPIFKILCFAAPPPLLETTPSAYETVHAGEASKTTRMREGPHRSSMKALRFVVKRPEFAAHTAGIHTA